jgi:hypothetical protein
MSFEKSSFPPAAGAEISYKMIIIGSITEIPAITGLLPINHKGRKCTSNII